MTDSYDYSEVNRLLRDYIKKSGRSQILAARVNLPPKMHPRDARIQISQAREAESEALAALDAADAAIPAAVKVMDEAK